MRKTLLVVLTILLAAMPMMALAQEDIAPASLAVGWLAEHQSDDGSFANDEDVTAVAAIAMASAGQPNAEALAWLEDAIASDTSASMDRLSIILMAVAANGQDPSGFADGATIGSFNNALRSERSNVSNMCSGLTGMVAMGQTPPSFAVGFLTGLQGEDGSFSSGDDTDALLITSLCLHVLVAAEQTDATDAALNFIATGQNEDGGWGIFEEGVSDAITTAFVVMGLNAAGADAAEGLAYLESQQDRESGAVLIVEDMDDADADLNLMATSFAILAFQGLSLNDIPTFAEATADTADISDTATGDEPPALDPNWAAVGGPFGMEELDSADDFFVTVVDPFTDDELYGVEIINFTAGYQYSGFIVEQYLPGEVLLWMAEQDPTVWDSLDDLVLEMLPPEELAKLPAEIQARVQ